MAMGDHDGNYDPSPIISEAESKWEKDKDIEGAVLVYQTALLEWGDDAMTGTDDESLRDGMASLYVAYANLYRKAKQYKSCEEAYEQAVEDPVVGGLGRLWLDYARCVFLGGFMDFGWCLVFGAHSLTFCNCVKGFVKNEVE